MTSTIVFGNGIGLALDHDYFKLETGLEEALKNLNSSEVDIIQLGKDHPPKEEEELENHHEVLTACQTLSDLRENGSPQWLSNEGMQFPSLYQNYIYRVAKHFFDYSTFECPELDTFTNNLSAFIRDSTSVPNRTCCHIATLNYDKLLYEALIDANILRGYDGYLVDGIWNAGFYRENLRRKQGNFFGWYLHLHGSPAFKTVKNDKTIKKCHLSSLPEVGLNDEEIHSHVVLTHTNLKPEIISKSKLLGTYFDYFKHALNQSEELFLFGYSGEDNHVNDSIKQRLEDTKRSNLKIYVIEWSGAPNNRKKYWKDALDTNIVPKICPLDNILNYDFTKSFSDNLKKKNSKVSGKK